jgi:hypothetical protein
MRAQDYPSNVSREEPRQFYLDRCRGVRSARACDFLMPVANLVPLQRNRVLLPIMWSNTLCRSWAEWR